VRATAEEIARHEGISSSSARATAEAAQATADARAQEISMLATSRVNALESSSESASNASLAYLAAASTISPDGRFLVYQAADNKLRIIDLSSEQIIALLDEQNPISAVAFNQKSDRLATGDINGTVRVYELPSGKEISRFESTQNGKVVLWDLDGSQVQVVAP
jgi:WD40 repeat protein